MLFTVYVPDDFAEYAPPSSLTSLDGTRKLIEDALRAAEIPATVTPTR